MRIFTYLFFDTAYVMLMYLLKRMLIAKIEATSKLTITQWVEFIKIVIKEKLKFNGFSK